MRFWEACLGLALTQAQLAIGTPIQLGVQDEVDILSNKALQNKIAYDAQPVMNKTCTASNAIVRREWGTLHPSERKKYTDAVLCLMNKPAKLSASDAPGIRSRYDDFLSVHIRQTLRIHYTGNFLTWHRYYIWTFEQALRDECGYDGYLPYWAWEKYVNNLLDSPLFDGSAYSMSGNGKYAPNNGTKIEGDAIVYIPPGQGGGCVTTGPFKNMSVNLGPVDPAYQSIGIKPQNGGTGLDYNPRCLRRDISSDSAKKWTSLDDVTGLLNNYTDISHFQDAMQGTPQTKVIGVHGGGHFTLGGDPGSDLYVSPGDPMFFLHHGMIDRVFWIWQNLDPGHRRHAVSGTMTMRNTPPSRNATLDDMVDLGGLRELQRLDDLLDTTSGAFCYVYT